MLAKCMLATPVLLQHLVPHLLEKLSARDVKTKVESLDLLTEMARKFTLPQLVDPSSDTQLLH